MPIKKLLGNEDGGGTTIARGTTLEFCKRCVDYRRFHDLLERIHVRELGVGVLWRVGVVNTSNFSEVLRLGAISLCRWSVTENIKGES